MNIAKPIQLFRIYLARYYAKLYPREMFVGVAGSVGKAACVTACNAVLSQKYQTLSTKPDGEALANIVSVLFKLNPKFKKVVLGMDGKDGMDLCLSLVRPETVVFTKTDGDEVLSTEIKLIENTGPDGLVILNWDDPKSRKLAEGREENVLYYGLDPKNCAVWAGNIHLENFATTFELNHGVERVKVNFKPLGLHQVYPALAASLVGIVADIPLTKIKLALEEIEAPEHCLQAVSGPNSSVLLDDTYSSSSVFDSAVDALLGLPARRRVIVVAEMHDLDGNPSEYARIAQRIYKDKLDFVFLGQGKTQFIADELLSLGFWEERLESNLHNSQLVGRLIKILGKGDVCLLTGSKAARLDEVVKRIAKKL